MALKPIEIILNAKDNASKVFDGLNAKMTAIAAAIAGYFGVNAFANVITGAGNFEEAMSRVQAATNTSGAELEKLKVAAEQAGATTKFTAIEAASALENLAKAGLNSEQAIAALPAVMNMAQAGGVSLADASERLTGVVMGMGLKFEDSARVADVLAMGANASRTSITGLAEAMSYAGPIAKTVGLSLESTVAIIAQFANAGIDASRAGTALNSILAQFSDPASKFREELSALGVNTRDFDQALKQLAAAGPKGAEAIRAVGLEAGPALQAALNLGIPALDALRTQLQGAEGSAAATAKIMGDNLNGALKGLGSAWDAVKNTLGEPVLPVLKQGVDELAGALRKGIEDGTIAKFGTSLATAFQAGIEWMRQFAATVDFNKVTSDMQTFATQAGELFDTIGRYAANAGEIVKLAYGVMSAGTNAVLTGVYGIGEAFAGVARDVMLGVAVIREGLAKITFGGLSESFKLAAEDARQTAQFFGETSVAMRAKAVDAFNGMADGAQLATDGFVGLSQASDGTKKSTEQGAQAVETLREALRKESEAAYAAIEAADKKSAADAKAAEQAEKHTKAVADNAAAIKTLKAEYTQAVKLGNWELVNELHQKLNAELKQGEFLSKQAAAATQQNAAANTQLAQSAEKSSAALALKSKVQQADLELEHSVLGLKKAGIDAAIAVAQAQGNEAEATRLKIDQKKVEIEIIKATVAVQKAEAEGSIAVAQAKMAELQASGDLTNSKRIELEVAIKSAQAKVNAAKATEQSTKGIEAEIDALRRNSGELGRTAQAHNRAAGAAVAHGAAVEDLAAKYDDAGARAAAAAGQFLSADLKQQNADTAKSSITNRPASEGQYAWTRQSIVEWLEQAGLSKEDAKKLSADFVDSNGDVPYSNNPGQLKYGGKYSTLTDALYKAAYPYLFGDSGKQKGGAQDLSSGPTKAPPPPHAPAPTPTPRLPAPPAPLITSAPPPASGSSAAITSAPSTSTRTINLNLNGVGLGGVNTDAPGEAVINKFMDELERSGRLTGAI